MYSMSSKKTLYLLSFLVLVLLFYAIAIYLGYTQKNMAFTLTKHQFHRAMVIEAASRPPGILNGKDTQRLVSNTSKISDGAQAVLSRKSAQELLNLPIVEEVMAMTKNKQKLVIGNSFVQNVDVFHVSKQFIDAFSLGDTTLFDEKKYVASQSLLKKLHHKIGAIDASLEMTDDTVKEFIDLGSTHTDFSNYKTTIKIAHNGLQLPGESDAFSHALFFIGNAPKANLPDDLLSVPKILLIVKLKHGIETETGMAQLKEFVDKATNIYDEAELKSRPLTQLFAEQLSMDYLQRWSVRLYQCVVLIAILLLIMFVLMRVVRVRTETALRRAMGASTLTSAWLSAKTSVQSVFTGVASISSIVLLLFYVFDRFIFTELLPMFYTLSAIAVCSAALLVLIGVFTARGEIMPQLKPGA